MARRRRRAPGAQGRRYRSRSVAARIHPGGAVAPGWARALAVAGLGGALALAALALSPAASHHSAAAVWSPLVLVAGLLLAGAVADADGVFTAAGAKASGVTPVRPLAALGPLAVAAVCPSPPRSSSALGRGRT